MIESAAVLGLSLMLASCENSSSGEDNGDTGGLDTEPPVIIVPIENLHEVVAGKTFIWDIPTMAWSVPKGSGPEFGQAVPDMMFTITEALENGSMTFFVGTADVDGTQSSCTTTVDVPATVTENPGFETTPMDFVTYGENLFEEAPVHQVKASMYGMALSGYFVVENGLVGIRKGAIEMVVDFRETYRLFHLRPNATPDSICEEAPDFNANCEACPSDGAPYCLALKAELISVDEAVGRSMNPIISTCFP